MIPLPVFSLPVICLRGGRDCEVARKPAQGEKKTSPQRGKARQGKAHQRQQPARPAPVTAMSQAFAKLTQKKSPD
jgi:hypothetical protein